MAYIADTFPLEQVGSSSALQCMGGHPDAELLDAWNSYVAANRAFAAVEGGTDEDHEPFYQAIDAARDRIEETSASTPEGLAVRLRVVFITEIATTNAYEHVVNGAPINLGGLKEHHDRMLWNLLCDAERIAKS